MKSIKYTLIISLLAALWPLTDAQACFGPWYHPRGYYMYRVDSPSAQSPSSRQGSAAHDNCVEWQRYAAPEIPLEDIRKVVYEMPLDAFETFHANRDKNRDDKNAFLRWMACEAPEAADFLLLAKTVEDVRSRQNSRWYYPSMKTGARMTLEELAEKTLTYRGPLRDRYLLQAIRCLFSMHRYADCVALWEKEASRLPRQSAMRQLIEGYIGGAEVHLAHYDKAMAHYAELGDTGAIVACVSNRQALSKVEIIERIYACDPNSSCLPSLLQELVRQAEPLGEWYSETDLVKPEHRQLARLALRIAQEGKTDNPAMWYYTAAFIEDLDGHAAKASALLARAERSRGTEFIDQSVRVMRIYLDAKLLPYDRAYERHLFEQLQWLDLKVVTDLTPQVQEHTAKLYDLFYSISYYYWNDMLRRILLGEVCPRMVKAGKPLRALQLANMADNRLLGLVDKATVTQGYYPNAVIRTVSMRQYRRDEQQDCHDYSNSFFELIDSLGVDLAVAYRSRIEKPHDAFDEFLNQRGYVDPEYIGDIIGTKYLRAMRYGEAEAELGRIGGSFDGHLNTTIRWNPFFLEREPVPVKDRSRFKYRFVREMHSIEQEMAASTSPDHKAELMLRYAVGLQNSFGYSWPLTQYYKGFHFFGQVQKKRDWEHEPETIRAKNRAHELFLQAFTLFTDRELAARKLYDFKQFRTVVEQYPGTKTSDYVHGHCDNLCDYALVTL